MVNQNEISNESIIYVSARIEQWIKDYAESNIFSEYELALRVAEFLYVQKSGQISRLINSLSTLRGKTSKGNKTSRKMEMVKRTYRKTQRIKTSKELKSGYPKGKKYNGTHWMQLPKNKAKVKKMMKERRQQYLAKLEKAA